jgi:hypothetical protein
MKNPNADAAITSGTAISSCRSAPSRLPPTTQASVTSASVGQRAPNVNGRRSLGSGTSSVIGFPVRFRGAFPNPLSRRLASLASRPADQTYPNADRPWKSCQRPACGPDALSSRASTRRTCDAGRSPRPVAPVQTRLRGSTCRGLRCCGYRAECTRGGLQQNQITRL